LILWHVRGETIRSYFCEFLGQSIQLNALEGNLAELEFASKQFKLRSLQIVSVLLIVVPFVVDILRNVSDFTFPLFYRGIKLHRVLSGVLKGLFEICDLSRELALGR